MQGWILTRVQEKIKENSINYFPGGSDSKGSFCNAGGLGLIPGFGRSLEEGMATHSSILAWRIPMTKEAGGLQSVGSQRVGHNRVVKHTHTWFRAVKHLSSRETGFSSSMVPSLPLSRWLSLMTCQSADLLGIFHVLLNLDLSQNARKVCFFYSLRAFFLLYFLYFIFFSSCFIFYLTSG